MVSTKMLNTVSASLAICMLALAGWHSQNPGHFELFSVSFHPPPPPRGGETPHLQNQMTKCGFPRWPSLAPHTHAGRDLAAVGVGLAACLRRGEGQGEGQVGEESEEPRGGAQLWGGAPRRRGSTAVGQGLGMLRAGWCQLRPAALPVCVEGAGRGGGEGKL